MSRNAVRSLQYRVFSFNGGKYSWNSVKIALSDVALWAVVVWCSRVDLRCLEHAHIGCICPWPAKVLYQRVTDKQLQSTRVQLRDLADKVQHNHWHHSLLCVSTCC